MILKTVFIRFYKSFNYDYLKKVQGKAAKQPWEMIGEMWYPYVKVPIDDKITTIVGANESGKSHLLSAIEKGISGTGIKREDFCRYSQFFTVERDEMKWADFGFEWGSLTNENKEYIRLVCGISANINFESFLIFRTGKSNLTVYIPANNTYQAHEVMAEKVDQFKNILPHVFRINSDVALPDSVSIKGLASGFAGAENGFETLRRKDRFSMVETVSPALSNAAWFESAETVTQFAANISTTFSRLLDKAELEDYSEKTKKERLAENRLAYDLICNVANVDPKALEELYQALRDEKEGHANGIIQEINNRLATSLNFPRWWVQDSNFRLIVSPREFDLVFTIRDRTDTDYSFNERSSGLKYFLSYYVQYRAHKPQNDRAEILLMDEPDTYLSSQAQQDLLKIFEGFAFPDDTRNPVQVIYVTHSPFLIDKNHAERIRVLEKGVSEEGTRVVKDAAKNHYEPLRSAFGAFVGETVFIGNCNLMVEGQSDQIFLAGIATNLRRLGASALETLDLNRITIVPAGSAPHIPYMVYLARGRDIEQPAVIVLLDSDTSGNDARKRLRKGGAYGKQLLKDDFILQIEDLKSEMGLAIDENIKLSEIEDLIPIPICAMAAQVYAREICGVTEEQVGNISVEAIATNLTGTNSVFDAITKCFESISEEMHIEKVGFARNVVDLVARESAQIKSSNLKTSIEQFFGNMKILFRRLNKIKRDAERELNNERVSQKINRLKNAFIQDHPENAKKEEASILFEDMDSALGDGAESDAIKLAIIGLRRQFEIEDDMTQFINNYGAFKEGLEQIKYAGRIATQIIENELEINKPEDGSKNAASKQKEKKSEETISEEKPK